MPANSTHPDYDSSAFDWSRARDVLSGEDAVKAAGEKYLPRLDSQAPEDYVAYRSRAGFFNATARSAEGFVGLIFRRPPFIKVPESQSGVGKALAGFVNDADMLGSTLAGYAKSVVSEVVGVGRAGSLVDWEGDVEKRAYVSLYAAEQILNWRVERVNGRTVPTLIVLSENAVVEDPDDPFEVQLQPQLRVLKLVQGNDGNGADGKREFQCLVEIWRQKDTGRKTAKVRWELVETKLPLRLGKPLPLIPFVFHGPRHSRPEVDRPPLRDIISVNLDHYRLNADYKHGMHYTALPTAWVTGFDKKSELKIGSSVVWQGDSADAKAGRRTMSKRCNGRVSAVRIRTRGCRLLCYCSPPVRTWTAMSCLKRCVTRPARWRESCWCSIGRLRRLVKALRRFTQVIQRRAVGALFPLTIPRHSTARVIRDRLSHALRRRCSRSMERRLTAARVLCGC